MSNSKRFIIGGVGGLAPVLMFLLAVDWEHYVVDSSTLELIGYCVRVIVLFFVGGFVAYLHSGERQPFKLFEVGMGAPALIAGYITTSLIPSLPGSANTDAHSTARFSIVASAYAQPHTTAPVIKHFTLPAQKPTAQFLQGLLGKQPKNIWFVIVGSHLRAEDATAQADHINSEFHDFHASVYAPYGDNPYYAVVIGANLTQAEARALRDKAVAAGFPKDSYYKTFPNLPPPVR